MAENTPRPTNPYDEWNTPSTGASEWTVPQPGTSSAGALQPAYESQGFTPGQPQQAPVYPAQPTYPSAGSPTGYAYDPMAQATPPKSYAVALLLAFFLGGIGAPDFYLGYKTTGWIKVGLFVGTFVTLPLYGLGLLFSVVLSIWAFVTFIMVLVRGGSMGHDSLGRPLG